MLELNKVIQGDCLEVMKKIDDRSIDMAICDLPYGVTARNKWDVIIPFEPLWEQYNRVIKEDGIVVLTAIQPFASIVVMSNLKLFRYEWIWKKQQGTGFLNAKIQPLRNHEQVLIFYKKLPTYNPQFIEGKAYVCKGGHKPGKSTMIYNDQIEITTYNKGIRYPLTVQEFPYDKEKLHPTQKPVALFEYLIRTYTNEGDLVLDNCAGSGTTGVACKNTNRNFILIEKEEKYCKIAEQRLKGEIVKKSKEDKFKGGFFE